MNDQVMNNKEENRDILVSVVIPAYNCEKTIVQTLDSALAQEVPLEVLVINDCSKDQTEAAVLEYVNHPERLNGYPLRYIKNSGNLGASGSRNRAVRLAYGKYVAFLDADDWWDCDKLKKQLALIEKEKMILCCTGRALMNPDGTPMGKEIPVSEYITYKQLLRHNCINCSSVLLLREVALEFPMECEDSHEDYIMWLKILKKYGTVCAVNEPLLKYRLSASGKSGSKLKSAKMTFKVYRYMGFGWLKSIACFCSYALNGVWKYR